VQEGVATTAAVTEAVVVAEGRLVAAEGVVPAEDHSAEGRVAEERKEGEGGGVGGGGGGRGEDTGGGGRWEEGRKGGGRAAQAAT
jgi:hypothetical protein